MLCKECNYPDSHIVETRHDDIKNITTRRRECLRCGVRFTTHENYRDSVRDYYKEIGK